VLRTRQALQTAIIELVIEQGYESTTVQHILDRTGVGRSTFYVHFKDKEELFKSTLDNLWQALEHMWQARLLNESKGMGELDFVLPFLKHIECSRIIYLAVVGKESGSIADRRFRRMFAEMARTDLACTIPDTIMLEAAVQHIVGALMSIVAWWMDCEIPLTAEQVNERFLQLSLTGIKSIQLHAQ